MGANQRFAARTSDPDGSFAYPMAVLTVSADKDYLALVRTTAMHVAGLLGLPIGRITDLRLAVDEACIAFLPEEPPAAADRPPLLPRMLEVRYDRYPDHLRVTVRAEVPRRWPDRDEVGWALLQALVGEVRTETAGGMGTLTLIEPLPTAR